MCCLCLDFLARSCCKGMQEQIRRPNPRRPKEGRTPKPELICRDPVRMLLLKCSALDLSETSSVQVCSGQTDSEKAARTRFGSQAQMKPCLLSVCRQVFFED